MSSLFQKTIAAFLATSAVVSACKVYPDSLLDPIEGQGGRAGGGASGAAGTSQAGPGFGVGFWSKKDANGCESAGVPTSQMRPKETAAEQLPPIYMAIDSLNLGSEDPNGVKSKTAWEGYGLDLDGACTSSATCGTVEDTPTQTCAAATPKVPIDGSLCRDNTFGQLQGGVADTAIGTNYRLTDDQFNCGLCLGRFTFVIKVSRYNGTPNDGDVRVDLYASAGLETPIQFECSTTWREQLYDNGLCWQNNQPFTVETSSMETPTAGPDLSPSKISDDGAYVRDGYLVMAMPASTRLWFPHTVNSPIYTFPFVLAGGVTVGRLSKKSNQEWTLDDGTIAGWAKGSDLIEGFERLGFCEGKDPLYSFMKTLVKNNQDIASDGSRDPTVPCDAITVGIPFKARQATVGGLIDTPFPERCAPGVPPGKGGAGGAAAGGSAGAGG